MQGHQVHHPGSCQQEGQLQQHTVCLSEPPTTCVASARRRRPNLPNCVSHYVFNLPRSPTPAPDTVANPLRYLLEAKLSVESDGNNGRSSIFRRYVVRPIANVSVPGGSTQRATQTLPASRRCPHGIAHTTQHTALCRSLERRTDKHTHIMCIQRARLHTRTASPTHAKYRSGSVPPPALSSPVCPIFSLSLPRVSLLACVFLITSTTIRNLSVLMCLSAWS
jgi:hypothetical protein